MAEATHGTVNWFEIGTDDPAGAGRFYGELFGWTTSDDGLYHMVGAGDVPIGGVFDTEGHAPNYAVFGVFVDDVPKACEQAQRLGGSVVVPVKTNPGGVTFAHLRDPHGNHFEIWTRDQ